MSASPSLSPSARLRAGLTRRGTSATIAGSAGASARAYKRECVTVTKLGIWAVWLARVLYDGHWTRQRCGSTG